MKILLVEDEKRMADALTELLRLEHYDVTVCGDGTAGCEEALSGVHDILVLDVMLPGLSGFEIAKRVRAAGLSSPILMLSAKSELDDKVAGLDCGADDYLTKPFETKELLARLRALGRRVPDEAPLTFGDISLNRANSMLSCPENGQSVRLGGKEYKIMEYLLENIGRLLSREQLALKIWGYENEAEYNNVEVYLTFTRRKLKFIGSKAEIKAVRNLGYELRMPE